MSNLSNRKFSPFLSVVIIIGTLLTTVIIKMEVVREGYELLKLGHYEKTEKDQSRRLQTEYSKLLRPERLDKIATQRLALSRVQKSQVVLMASGNWAVRQ